MTSQKPQRTRQKQLTTRGRVFCWVMIVFVLLTTCAAGLTLIIEGIDGRRALAHGPVGTLTPTDRKCGDESCTWVGTFASADGTVTEEDVELKDAEKVRFSAPMPATIDDVRLDDEDTRPTAYTADYNWRGSVFKGSFVILFGLGISGGLVMMLKRHRPTAVSS
ncbi:hypothetical protein [Parafrankia sp. BMG5.11]|uniref:hypothetical protein n=1 Tax=Parafrankia sp. BMG5.11 TaxID=222540 RepID=UPI00103BE955|nr:hypothetical protein [Parafrankia sp. BMG5.11]TCJ30972.1 hypothetical protein E0504_49510 [Parafrankia sp. BMG5.11]